MEKCLNILYFAVFRVYLFQYFIFCLFRVYAGDVSGTERFKSFKLPEDRLHFKDINSIKVEN